MPEVPRLTSPTASPQGFLPEGPGPEAFGSQVGQATQRLGAGIEEGGDVLAKHALKMQTQLNTAQAKEMFFNATKELGDAEAEYRSLEGINAVEAQQKYNTKITAIRDKYLDAAQNPEVKRIFDQDFTRRLGFSVVDGAHYAATQKKKYVTDSATATKGLAVENSGQDPENKGLADFNIGQIKSSNALLRSEHGWSEDHEKLINQDDISKFNKNRVIQTARDEPNRATNLLDEVRGSMKAEDIAHAEDQIRKQEHARLIDESRGHTLAHQRLKEISDKEERQVMLAIEQNPQSVTAKQVFQDNLLSIDAARRVNGYLKASLKPQDAAVSRETTLSFLERMRLDDGDPLKITTPDEFEKALDDGRLTTKDYSMLTKKLYQDRSDLGRTLEQDKKRFLDAYKTSITKSNPLMGTADNTGDQQYYRFQMELDNRIEQMRTEKKDPRALFNPNSPEFLGSPKFLSQYQTTIQQSNQNIRERFSTKPANADAGAPPAPNRAIPRNPGESWADYKKRTGKSD